MELEDDGQISDLPEGLLLLAAAAFSCSWAHWQVGLAGAGLGKWALWQHQMTLYLHCMSMAVTVTATILLLLGVRLVDSDELWHLKSQHTWHDLLYPQSRSVLSVWAGADIVDWSGGAGQDWARQGGPLCVGPPSQPSSLWLCRVGSNYSIHYCRNFAFTNIAMHWSFENCPQQKQNATNVSKNKPRLQNTSLGTLRRYWRRNFVSWGLASFHPSHAVPFPFYLINARTEQHKWLLSCMIDQKDPRYKSFLW